MVSEGRQKRLADNVAKTAAQLILTELKDPLPGVVTVTAAEITRDLGRATVYYTVLGSDEDRRRAMRRLGQVRHFVQREVARRLHLRVTPDLRFRYDDRTRQGADVLRLLAELRNDERNEDDPTNA
jgi:ribosome-binding factor A